MIVCFFCFKQKTAYEMRISDWSSDVCSSDLPKGHLYQRYRGATVITPNRSEMQDAVGRWKDENELEQRAQKLRTDLDLEALLVTRSEQGMTLFSEQGRQHTDAYAHEVFDVSGAGDTVLAELAVTRAAGLDWFEAVMWRSEERRVGEGCCSTVRTWGAPVS